MLAALAATISLGGCAAPRDGYSSMDHRRNVHQFRSEELGRADVRKVQRSLTREGFYHGKIDGVWGRDTSQAILDYQVARHPGQTDVTADTLQEFGVRMDEDRYRSRQ